MLLQIISILTEILAELKGIKAALQGVYAPQPSADEELLDNSDAKRLLKVGDKTLYRWRKNKQINSHIIGNKHYYIKADLIKAKKNL